VQPTLCILTFTSRTVTICEGQSINKGNICITPDGGCFERKGWCQCSSHFWYVGWWVQHQCVTRKQARTTVSSMAVHRCSAQRTVCCYLICVVRSEDSRNSSPNAPSEWRKLSRPKESVRVGGITEKWKQKRSGWTASRQATDSKGPLLEHCPVESRTVNSEQYCALLTDELKPAIRTKWRGR
jgi:hypothetical protein